METAKTDEIFYRPCHPYTRALQKSRPALQAKGAELYTIPGMPPDVSKPIAGCAFKNRCEFALESCKQAPMTLAEMAPGHGTACPRVWSGELKL
jgi:oligopeptide transport system ATP-binding protein